MKEKLKNLISGEKVKIKSMTFKQKREYIWEYYKLHIIAIMFFIFFAGSMINSIFINPPKKSFTHIAFFDAYVTEEFTNNLAEILTEDVVTDKDKEQVYTSNFFMGSEDPQVDMAMMQKFVAMIAAKELDLLVTDKMNFEGMCLDGYFWDLTEFLTESDLDTYQDRLLEGSLEGEDESCIFGIALDDNVFLEESGMSTDNQVLAIIASADLERMENISAIIRYILKES